MRYKYVVAYSNGFLFGIDELEHFVRKRMYGPDSLPEKVYIDPFPTSSPTIEGGYPDNISTDRDEIQVGYETMDEPKNIQKGKFFTLFGSIPAVSGLSEVDIFIPKGDKDIFIGYVMVAKLEEGVDSCGVENIKNLKKALKYM